MDTLFTRDDAWHGGFYELCFELPESSKTAAQHALNALWTTPQLDGCYLRRDVEPSRQQKVSPLNALTEGHTFGVATFPDRTMCACGSYAANYDADGWWITFYLPLGSLASLYSVGAYPFGGNDEPSPEGWLRPLNAWLCDIAEAVYKQARFSIAFVGFEVDFVSLKEQAAVGVPAERWEGILLPAQSTLEWHPPTVYQHQFE